MLTVESQNIFLKLLPSGAQRTLEVETKVGSIRLNLGLLNEYKLVPRRKINNRSRRQEGSPRLHRNHSNCGGR